MKLSELIAHIGDENIFVQNLATNMKSAKAAMKNRDAEITFVTSDDKVLDRMIGKPRFVGLVVWLPVDKMPDGYK